MAAARWIMSPQQQEPKLRNSRLSLSLKRLCLNKKSKLFANLQSAKSSFVKIGRTLFNPGKLWVVSVAVLGGSRGPESGRLGLPELPGATRSYPPSLFFSREIFKKKTKLDFITLFNLERGEEG